jgi:hypothetical protein
VTGPEDARQRRAREQGLERIRNGAEPPAPADPREQILDYLLGNDG